VRLLGQQVDSVKREHDELQGLSWQQQEEKEQSAKELKAVRETLALEEGVQKSLKVAAEAAKMILEVDKEQIIQKQLEVLYRGEAQPFKRLYKSMQDFSNDIMQVQEGLEGELKTIRLYLKEKHWPAVEENQKEDQKAEEKGKEVIEVPSSNSEGEQPAGVRRLGLSKAAKKAPESKPDADKHVVPFQPPEEKSEPETGRAEDYIALPDQLAQEQQPTVEQIHKECLAKYPDTLPPGPMSMASGSLAYLATPAASKPPRPPLPPQQQQQDNQLAL
jgi:hypothetical protein